MHFQHTLLPVQKRFLSAAAVSSPLLRLRIMFASPVRTRCSRCTASRHTTNSACSTLTTNSRSSE